jgi:5-methylcytosine-specific restriction enzyme A
MSERAGPVPEDESLADAEIPNWKRFGLKPETIARRAAKAADRAERKARNRAGTDLERVGVVRGGRSEHVGLVTFPNWNRDHVHGEDWEDLFDVDTEWERRMAMHALAGVRTKRTSWFHCPDTPERKVTRQRARAAELGLPHDLTPTEWTAIVEAYRGECAYCGIPEGLVMDHVWPVYHGGGTTRGNVVPACWHCNSLKSRMTPVDFFVLYPDRGNRFKRMQAEAIETLEKRKAG